MISLLAAMDQNRVIGYKNDLPWRLPNDLKFFKQKTTGNTIFMGRKTFEAIGKPLPNRENVVITRKQKAHFPEGVEVVHDVNTVLQWNDEHPDDELFIIGGSTIFEQFLAHADRLYITFIDDSFPGDTYFPLFTEKYWQLTAEEKGERNDKNPYDYYFRQYDRR
ncbi:dihydrofolate reductase DfrA [Lentibacillus halophilus]|uniref:Dihydrofolate reductase n=1 Tax=Lentibacillus halophilus TaxID=295065 RepID=A0ABP3J8S6_9BACI